MRREFEDKAAKLIGSDLRDLGFAANKLAKNAVKLAAVSGAGVTVLESIASIAAIYLLILDRTNWNTNILTSLLIPYIFFSLPSWIFGFFSLQPLRDTRKKQVQLWKDLILDYCRTQKVFVIGLEEEFSLFSNPVIGRSLTYEAREAFLSTLVADGRAEWMDKGHRKCLILWHRIHEWAETLVQFARDNGLEDGIVTMEEIRFGTESQGTASKQINCEICSKAMEQVSKNQALVDTIGEPIVKALDRAHRIGQKK
ncbi:vacuolar protein sorting-associated protein 25-like isoform X1 [Arachis stenosperma]|uniref:vacuolar protein sorting-associated protein 25-like isoform X1 n=1 Tax=Arachis stenosperma TaxID=217475 RepID=UPI0025AC5474|nr:vacuolar protein sorting-associated protein 25-like isoform X1 [Arachis stenosperma]